MNLVGLLDDIEIERQRRIKGLLEPDPHAIELWARALAALPDKAERIRLEHAFNFAKEI